VCKIHDDFPALAEKVKEAKAMPPLPLLLLLLADGLRVRRWTALA